MMMKKALMCAALCLAISGVYAADKEKAEKADKPFKADVKPKADKVPVEKRVKNTTMAAAGGVDKPRTNTNMVYPVPKTEKPGKDKPKTPAETPKPKSNPATPVGSGDATQGDGYKGPKVVVPVPAYGPGSQVPEKPKNQAGGGMTVNGSAGGSGGKVGPAREKY